MKICTKCNRLKPLEAFYKKSRGKEGRDSRCAECWRALDQLRSQSLRRKAQKAAAALSSRKRYPEKHSARKIVQSLLRTYKGDKKCVICGDQKVDAHHPDYSKPDEVVFLCRKHHSEVHKSGNDKSLLNYLVSLGAGHRPQAARTHQVV